MTCYNYILFYLLIFIHLFLEIESFIPTGRLAHSSVLVGNKLYFFGGEKNNNFCSNEVFFLDVSRPFNIQTPPWNDLTPNSGLPFKSCWGTVSSSDIDNKTTIYLIGGNTYDIVTDEENFESFIYSFNLISLTWNVPIFKGKLPERRTEMKSVIDDTGKIYIFGGSSIGDNVHTFNDMVILDTVGLSWSILNSANSPTPRAGYSVTLLSNGVIVYIGGYLYVNGVFNNVDISQIFLYDTTTLTWTNKTAKLIDQVGNRDTHTAVLAPEGKIIVYGGIMGDFTQVTPAIAVLNTKTDPFEWTAPFVSSNVGKIPSLAGHTANIVGNYMIVAFGNITQPGGYPLELKNTNIYLLDVISHTWVYTFENIAEPTPSNPTQMPATSSSVNNSFSTQTPTSTDTSANNLESNNQLTTMKIVIGTLSGVVGTAILMTIGILGYRWHRRQQSRQIEISDEIIRVHGTST